MKNKLINFDFNSDNLMILAILFFLYTQNVDDKMLYMVLILLLIT